MKIGIIGYGVVGKAIANTLSEKYVIVKYDKFEKYDEFKDLKNCNFIFISVPTPFDHDRDNIIDDSVVESLESLVKISYEGVVIIKSTLPVGACKSYYKKYDLQFY